MTTAPETRLIDPRWVGRLPLIAVGLLLLTLSSPRVRGEPGLLWSILGAAVLGGAFAAVAILQARARERALEIELWPKAPHLLQIAAHGVVYGYWAWHHPPTAEQLVLVAAQIPFAYLLEMGVGWRRYGRFRLGFGPIPIVGSINLFLWMVDALFAVQFLMVALAYASREYFKWTREGQRRHIFNPSAIALALVSIVLIATGSTELARGEEIAVSLGAGPHCYTAIFIAGLIVQIRFPVVLTTLAAVGSNLLLGWLWHASTGTWYYIDTAIPVAVFLGMTLLVTDPATSPRNGVGQVLYGALYGLSVFGLYTGLDALSEGFWSRDITYFDKLLAVPLLNLMTPLLQRMGEALTPATLAARLAPTRWNALHVATYAGVFLLAQPALTESPGRAVEPWVAACAAEESGACFRLGKVYSNRCVVAEPPAGCVEAAPMVLPEACAGGLPTACALYGRMLALGTAAIPADPAASVAPLETACEGGRYDACGQLGLMLWKGHGMPIDTNRADTLLEKACDGGIGVSCEHLGTMLDAVGPPGSRYRAILALERGCAKQHAIACAMAGEWYATGKGVHQSRRQAREMLGQACKLGLQPACRRRDELR